MSYESNVSYVSKQPRQKNTLNLCNMKADSARRIGRYPSSIGQELVLEHEYGDSAMCGRGHGISTGPQRDTCLTFPHRVYSTPLLFSWSFPLRPDVWDSPTAPRLTRYCRSSVLSWGTADNDSISFHSCTALLLY